MGAGANDRRTSVPKMRIFETPNETQSTTVAQTHLKGFGDPLRVFYLPPADATHHCFLSQLVKIPPPRPNNENPFLVGG